MKKHILSLILVGLAVACSQQPSYKLTVTGFPAAYEGKTIYLKKDTSFNTVVNIDSAVVHKGTLNMKGEWLGESSFALLGFEDWRKVKPPYNKVDFILEEGNITVSLDSVSQTIAGTPNNDLYQQLKVLSAESKSITDEYMKYYNELEKNTGENKAILDELEKIFERMKGISEEVREIKKTLLSTNSKNTIGRDMFLEDSRLFTAAERIEFINQLTEETQQIPRIVNIRKIAEAEAATSEGKKYRDIKGNTLDGKELALSEIVSKNKYTLLDFWASWCGPCIAEVPHVKKVYAKYKSKGFEVYGASIDADAEAWKGAAKAHSLPWQHVILDGKDKTGGAFLYGVQGIPYTVLIDQEGTIVKINLRGEKLMETLDELMK